MTSILVRSINLKLETKKLTLDCDISELEREIENSEIPINYKLKGSNAYTNEEGFILEIQEAEARANKYNAVTQSRSHARASSVVVLRVSCCS